MKYVINGTNKSLPDKGEEFRNKSLLKRNFDNREDEKEKRRNIFRKK